jgi:hypothetical protein
MGMGDNLRRQRYRDPLLEYYLRGTIAIHAGLNRDRDATLARCIKSPSEGEIVRGAIIGVVDLIGTVDYHCSKWFCGPFGFLLM